mmetsp:Transcript_14089/g.39907  ORF Transcript_14089/g.39907 Transcript_14089/m.39907 type:complete len:340 (-) Transcript_14089:774-1793(-)
MGVALTGGTAARSGQSWGHDLPSPSTPGMVSSPYSQTLLPQMPLTSTSVRNRIRMDLGWSLCSSGLSCERKAAASRSSGCSKPESGAGGGMNKGTSTSTHRSSTAGSSSPAAVAAEPSPARLAKVVPSGPAASSSLRPPICFIPFTSIWMWSGVTKKLANSSPIRSLRSPMRASTSRVSLATIRSTVWRMHVASPPLHTPQESTMSVQQASEASRASGGWQQRLFLSSRHSVVPVLSSQPALFGPPFLVAMRPSTSSSQVCISSSRLSTFISSPLTATCSLASWPWLPALVAAGTLTFSPSGSSLARVEPFLSRGVPQSATTTTLSYCEGPLCCEPTLP